MASTLSRLGLAALLLLATACGPPEDELPGTGRQAEWTRDLAEEIRRARQGSPPDEDSWFEEYQRLNPPGKSEPIGCQHMPWPPGLTRRFQGHDCWRFYGPKSRMQNVMGGVDPEDPDQGLIILLLPGEPSILATPNAGSDVEPYYMESLLVCFRDERGNIGALDVETMEFLSSEEAHNRCPPYATRGPNVD